MSFSSGSVSTSISWTSQTSNGPVAAVESGGAGQSDSFAPVSDGDPAEHGLADLAYATQVEIAIGDYVDIDLTDLTNGLGEPVVFARVKAIQVRHLGDVDGEYQLDSQVAVGNAPTDVFSGPFGDVDTSVALIFPAGIILLASGLGGWPVDSSKRSLRISNTGASIVIVELSILGAAS